MKVATKIPLMEPILTDEMIDAAINAFKTERYLKGKSVKKLEEEFANFIGTEHAIAVNSGTSALHLSLIAMDIKEEDYIVKAHSGIIGQSRIITIDRLIYVVPTVYGKLSMNNRYILARLIGKLAHYKKNGEKKETRTWKTVQ